MRNYSTIYEHKFFNVAFNLKSKTTLNAIDNELEKYLIELNESCEIEDYQNRIFCKSEKYDIDYYLYPTSFLKNFIEFIEDFEELHKYMHKDVLKDLLDK